MLLARLFVDTRSFASFLPLTTLLVLITICCASTATAQCGDWDTYISPPLDMDDDVEALTTWDPDGDGPLRPQMVAGGRFLTAGATFANHIAIWDGAAWQPLGAGTSFPVHALTSWDPDGQGPKHPLLIAGGSFADADGTRVNRIAAWDGVAWHGLEGGMNASVYALATWDPDGDGPLPALLVAGGGFTSAGGRVANRIATWDGSTWKALGLGMSNDVRALTEWDPDGEGPATAHLVAAGLFTSAGGSPAARVARWDGIEWRPFGAGLNDDVIAACVWDVDEHGPAQPTLFVGGEFTTADGQPAMKIAAWDGDNWAALAGGMNSAVKALIVWDPDLDGPMAPELVAGGSFSHVDGVPLGGMARWNGDSWQPFAESVRWVLDLILFDQDGPGPAMPRLIVGGSFSYAAETNLACIAQWEGRHWVPMSSGLNDRVRVLITWDPDADGPQPECLVAGGHFTAAGGQRANRVAVWNGYAWSRLGDGFDNYVNALCVWDPDGFGPLPATLVAGGAFTEADGRVVNHIAIWDGDTWRDIGQGLDGYVDTLGTWDPDGVGPQKPNLIVAGDFQTAGAVPASRIARWDGGKWWPLGPGMYEDGGSVHALSTWDFDGTGPQPPRLIAGGRFNITGTSYRHFASWNGTTWQMPLPALSDEVLSITSWDPDIDGPLPKQMYVGGKFLRVGAAVFNRVAYWNGTWNTMGTGMNNTVSTMTVWDPDGSGPLPTAPVAAGAFTTADNRPARGIARWGAGGWQSFDPHSAKSIDYLTTFSTPYDLNGSRTLIASMNFDPVSGRAVAAWNNRDPKIVTQSSHAAAVVGNGIALSVQAVNEPLTYQWTRGGINVSDGTTPYGSIIRGSNTRSLRIANSGFEDSGEYYCRVSSPCGTIESSLVILEIVPLCIADYNGDAWTDILDVCDFLEDMATCEIEPPPCGTRGNPDINADTLIDILDFLDFFEAFGTGC